jgi:hypothetical protein
MPANRSLGTEGRRRTRSMHLTLLFLHLLYPVNSEVSFRNPLGCD